MTAYTKARQREAAECKAALRRAWEAKAGEPLGIFARLFVLHLEVRVAEAAYQDATFQNRHGAESFRPFRAAEAALGEMLEPGMAESLFPLYAHLVDFYTDTFRDYEEVPA